MQDPTPFICASPFIRDVFVDATPFVRAPGVTHPLLKQVADGNGDRDNTELVYFLRSRPPRQFQATGQTAISVEV